ncbi:MAG TPA: alpha/beta hydrolase [Anaeromyxobacteraceae bacterium]|nr:alpha/beta hydrolase [Anaeromyxobacteraceae bacterium]
MPVPAFPATSEATHEEGFLNSVDHLRLYWQRYRPPAPRATVAVLHGGGDHSGRYPALTAALVRAGFEVALVDFRGHGQSDGRRWHVDVFGDYLADLDAFLASLRAGGVAGKLFVLGHSQGALVAARWALEHGRDGGVAGFVLSSPYLRLALEAPLLKVLAARVMGKIVPWLPVATGIAPAALTSDPELQTWTAHDPLYGRATTPRWFEESTRAQQEVARRAGELEAPLLVVAAGADTIADVGAARRFLEAARSRDKKLVVYDGFRHELFNEVGRERPIAEVVSWISARCG